MEKSKSLNGRAGNLAKTACLACRRLKMKCVGGDNPPCARCIQAGRNCVLPYNRGQRLTSPVYAVGPPVMHGVPHQIVQDVSTAFDAQGAMSVDTYWTGSDFGVWAQVPGTQTPPQALMPDNHAPSGMRTPEELFKIVPSYTPSPWHQFDVVSMLPSKPGIDTSASKLPKVKAVTAPCTPRCSPKASPTERGKTCPSHEEMSHLCQFFVMHLLKYVPVLGQVDTDDFEHLIKSREQLVYSMAYTAAHFVPGCKAIQAMLLPDVLAISRLPGQISHQRSLTEDQCWTLMMALAVLYTWSSLQDHIQEPNLPSSEILRSAIETLVARGDLHKSVEEVVKLLNTREDVGKVQQTFAFRKYLYWLWMYEGFHFRSLLTRQPTRMREDSSIILATQILQNLQHDHQVQEILASIELALIWTRNAAHARECSEWWCTMPVRDRTSLKSSLAILTDMYEALEDWRKKWLNPQKTAPPTGVSVDSSSLDIHYHFTHFCIREHMVKMACSSSTVGSSPQLVLNLLKASLESASMLCALPQKFTPLAKSSIRFMPDIAFVMIATCCDYVIRSHKLLSSLDIIPTSYLNSVRGVAEIITNLGAGNKHGARTYGDFIVTKLEEAERSVPNWGDVPVPTRSDTFRSISKSNTFESLTPQTFLENVATIDGVWPVQFNTIVAQTRTAGQRHKMGTFADDSAGIEFEHNGSAGRGICWSDLSLNSMPPVEAG